jgi:hypothetical protein
MCSSEKYREITASDQWCSDQCYKVSTSSTENMVSTFEIEDDAYLHTKTPASTNNKKQEETVSRNQCEEWKIQVPSVLNSHSSEAVSSGISGMLSSEIVSSDRPLLEPVSFVDLLNQNTPGSSIESVSMYSCSSSETDEDQNEYDDFEMDPLDKDENDSDDGMSGSENEINSIEEPAFYSTKTVKKLPISCSIGTQQDASDLYPNEARIKSRRILFAKNPADVFFELLPQPFWCEVVRRTNLYRQKYFKEYKAINLGELIRCIGLLLAHSLYPCKGGIKYNWERKAEYPFHQGSFGATMSRNRYFEIMRCLHFTDTVEEVDSPDKFYKIRMFFECMNKTFDAAYELGRDCSFDEGTIASRSRFMPAKQFNPNKPKKWGVKLFMLCCSRTGFCTRFEPYMGKIGNKSDNVAGPDSLYRNVLHLAHTGRIIYCDRYYSSVTLFYNLLSIGLYACGTVQTRRIGFSKEIQICKNEQVQRGTMRLAHSKHGNHVVDQISWKDSKPVNMISTGIGVTHVTVQRREKGKKEKTPVLAAEPLLRYQKNMGGVDLHDFYRMARFSLQDSIHVRKWYKTLFAACVDLVTTNCYILWKMMHGKKTSRYMTHFEFLRNLSICFVSYKEEAIEVSSGQNTPIIGQVSNNLKRFDNHEVQQFKPGEGYQGRGKRYKLCYVCYNVKKQKRLAEFYCSSCNVPCCLKVHDDLSLCWNMLHENVELLAKVAKKKGSAQQRSTLLSPQDIRADSRREIQRINSNRTKSPMIQMPRYKQRKIQTD